MELSIIVPVYRAEHCISTCIDSILTQKYQDFELILVDDGAPDRSGQICDEYAKRDSRIQVIHKKNGGVSSARNAGLEMAGGRYILFVDSDDYVEPEYASAMLSAAKEHPDCGHIWCGFQTVTDYNHSNAAPNLRTGKRVLWFNRTEIMTLHELWLDTGPCNKLYRMDVIRENAIRFPEDLSLGEDWLFNLQYLDAAPSERILVVTKPLYNYVRTGQASLDEGYRPDMLQIYRRLNSTCEEYLKKWAVPEEQVQKFYNSRFYTYEKVLYNTFRSPNRANREKYRWNRRLMKSEEFRKALAERDCWIHPLYLLAYRLASYRLIAALNLLQKAKKRLQSARRRA